MQLSFALARLERVGQDCDFMLPRNKVRHGALEVFRRYNTS